MGLFIKNKNKATKEVGMARSVQTGSGSFGKTAWFYGDPNDYGNHVKLSKNEVLEAMWLRIEYLEDYTARLSREIGDLHQKELERELKKRKRGD